MRLFQDEHSYKEVSSAILRAFLNFLNSAHSNGQALCRIFCLSQSELDHSREDAVEDYLISKSCGYYIGIRNLFGKIFVRFFIGGADELENLSIFPPNNPFQVIDLCISRILLEMMMFIILATRFTYLSRLEFLITSRE